MTSVGTSTLPRRAPGRSAGRNDPGSRGDGEAHVRHTYRDDPGSSAVLPATPGHGCPARLAALETAALEIERHVAAAGWDQPPRLFALVPPPSCCERSRRSPPQLGRRGDPRPSRRSSRRSCPRRTPSTSCSRASAGRPRSPAPRWSSSGWCCRPRPRPACRATSGGAAPGSRTTPSARRYASPWRCCATGVAPACCACGPTTERRPARPGPGAGAGRGPGRDAGGLTARQQVGQAARRFFSRDRRRRGDGLLERGHLDHPQPVGDRPRTSSQLSAGARNHVAPASRAPTSFCWMPPIGPTVPASSIVPVPATNAPRSAGPG